jgi:DNA-binding MarR family transcriptional regulator
MAITVKNMRKSPGYLLRCAHQYAVAIVSEHLAPLGLTTVQFSTLVALNENPGLDATRLSALINFDRPTLTGVLDRLEAKGLLVRKPDPNDRRARALFLTTQGEQMVADVDKAAHRSRDVILDPLPPAERKQFMLLLDKLVEAHHKRASPTVQAKIESGG